MISSDHEFGGVSTDLKLNLVEGYLRAYTTALRKKFSKLWYIDAFAGTGERTVKYEAQAASLLDPATDERIERLRGSAKIAIDVNPKFDRLFFIDANRKHCDALRALKSANLDREIDVLENDANEAIKDLLKMNIWNETRAVMFLDPYGMSVNWETLKLIRATGAIDVWYLVSLSGLFRQAARDRSAIDRSKHEAITRILGTSDWEDAWYKRTKTIDLFGESDDQVARQADVNAMENFVWDQLRSLFPKVLKPLRLKNDRGTPLFSLFFAISNPEPKAIGLASKIAGHILASGRSSHVRPK